MAESAVLFDIISLLIAAVVIVPLLKRLHIPPVLGYLVAGVVLGPYTPGPVVNVELTRPLAEFGIVFLLFAIGLEMPLSRLKIMRKYIFGFGALQVLLSALLLGGGALWLGQPLSLAIVLGLTLAFSSTAAVLSILTGKNETITTCGRLSVAVLIFQDLAVLPVLVLLPLLAHPDGQGIMQALLLAAGKAVLALAGIFAAGRLVIRPLFRFVSATRIPEVFTAAALLLILAVGWMTEHVGMSMALGAFLAGLLLADTSYRHQVEADITPFRGLLLGLFFITVGMSVNLPVVSSHLAGILTLTIGCMLLKTLVIAGLAVAGGFGLAQGLHLGLLLSQVGEFGFIVFARSADLGLIPADLSQQLGAAVALSMVLTPLAAALGRRLFSQMSVRIPAAVSPVALTPESLPHVLIAGYGRVGRAVARVLEDQGIPWMALDLDADRVARCQRKALPVYFGDARHIGVLHSAGLEQARAIVITVNKRDGGEMILETLHGLPHHPPIFARAHDIGQERQLEALGATVSIPETAEVSLSLAGLVLQQTGRQDGSVQDVLNRYRADRYHMLEETV